MKPRVTRHGVVFHRLNGPQVYGSLSAKGTGLVDGRLSHTIRKLDGRVTRTDPRPQRRRNLREHRADGIQCGDRLAVLSAGGIALIQCLEKRLRKISSHAVRRPWQWGYSVPCGEIERELSRLLEQQLVLLRQLR